MQSERSSNRSGARGQGSGSDDSDGSNDNGGGSDADNSNALEAELNVQPEAPAAPELGTLEHAENEVHLSGENPRTKQTSAQLLHRGAWIVLLSMWGTLLRLALIWLGDHLFFLWPGVVWAQFFGCVAMGFLTEDSLLFPKDRSKYEALYLGLTSGFCGSLTTFSAWALQTYEAAANIDGAERNGGYNVLAALAQLLLTLAMAVAGFRLGNHVGILFSHLPQRVLLRFPVLRPRSDSVFLISTISLVALAQIGSAIAASVLLPSWRGRGSIALTLTPVGAMLRWQLGSRLNARIDGFPLGTFSANMLATTLEAVAYLLQHYVRNGSSSCAVLQAVQDGLCGALSTISTFTLELCTLKLIHAYRYGAASVVSAVAICVLVAGTDFWLHGGARSYANQCVN